MRARFLLPVLLGLVAATVAVPSVARAEPPSDAEPSLFVVRAPASHDDGVLIVRTRDLEWFTDRPNRDAGSLTAKELVEHWNGWGFKDDPPNAALLGDEVDVIAELSKPRVRAGALRFDFEPIRGEADNGKLGTVSLLIDPTGWGGYQLTVVNNSTNATNFVLYQTNPDANVPNLLSLAWFSKFASPTTTLTFQWDQSYQLMWAQTGTLLPGVTFDAGGTIDVNPVPGENSVLLTAPEGDFEFAAGGAEVPDGSVGLTMDGTIPANTASYALSQTLQPVFAAQAQPNFNAVFTPRPEYWLTFGQYQQGEALDTEQIINNVQIQFPPGVTSMTATLNPDNTWTVQSTG